MIGIVLVSHSAAITDGILALVRQMVGDRVPMAAAGGTSVTAAPIGTDPLKVLAAMEAVYSTDGVLVLMDVGSAIMSAETAIDMLPGDQQQRIYLCEAPLVEGALAAAVRAMTGGSIEQVFAEARSALAVKADHLAPLLRTPAITAPVAAQVLEEGARGEEEAYVLSFPMPTRLGLHARPAARLVSLCSKFDAQVTVACHGRTAPATSMNQVATLGARHGDVLTLRAVGAEAAQALAAIESLAADNFGDPLDDHSPMAGSKMAAAPADANEIAGIPASPGVAIGPVAIYRTVISEVGEEIVADAAVELARLAAAVAAVVQALLTLRGEMTRRVGAAEAGIFDAHLLMLQDAELLRAAQHDIELRRVNAAAAWQHAIQGLVARYQALEDPYLARRAEDLMDVGQRVLRQLLGLDRDAGSMEMNEPAIVVAHDLKPSDVARLPTAMVLGLITEAGGANGHSVILARALAIPAVAGVGPILNRLEQGQAVALDGATGQIWLDPAPTLLVDLRARQLAQQAEMATTREKARQPAVLRDGRRIEIGANINLLADVAQALAFGAEGVGLFRTEYLFMDRTAPPSEEEQYAAYVETARRLGGLPLIVRTLDAGGDKPLEYLPVGHELNPFLGQRGLRYCLEHPGIFKPQLRAILRAAAAFPIKLMYPMVSALDELLLADALVDECCAELQAEGLPFDDDLEIGIMVEVPAAVLAAEHLARFVDFMSIGTNDLAQYIMAADRGNAAVAGLVSPFQPAVLHAIHQVVAAGHAAGIWVGLCGELGGDPVAAPLLAGLGLDELSMNATAIPPMKARIRNTDAAAATGIATTVLGMLTVQEITDYLQEFAGTQEGV